MTEKTNDTDARPVFRKEVAQRRANSWLGEVRASNSFPKYLPWVLALLFLAGVLVLAFVSAYRSQALVSGQLQPIGGLLNVDLDMAGTIASLKVAEGSVVESGQPLAIVHSKREIEAGSYAQLLEKQLEERLRQLEIELVNLEEREERARSESESELSSIREDLRTLDKEGEIHQERIRIAEDIRSRVETLKREGLISAMELSRYEAEILNARSNALNHQRQVLSAQRQIQAAGRTLSAKLAEIQDRRIQIAKETAIVASERTDLQARSERVLRSPDSGEISALLVEEGQTLPSGSTIARITPRGAELEAILYVPSQAIASLKSGDALQLRVAAFPYQRYGLQRAAVSQISNTTVPDAHGEAYRVRARLEKQHVSYEGTDYPLLSGMRVESNVVIEEGSFASRALSGALHFIRGLSN